MTTFIRTLFVGCLVLGLSAPFAAGQDQDVEGSKDHPLISRYPGSVITRYLTKEFDEFTLPLGKLVDEKNLPRASLWKGRSPASFTWRPRDARCWRSFATIKARSRRPGSRRSLLAARRRLRELDCKCVRYSGDNDDYWGPEHGIQYVSAKLARPEGDVYVSLLIDDQGGDSRANAELYVIEMKPMESDLITVDAASLANDINRTGHASVYGIYFDTGKADIKPESDATLKEIAKLLQGDPKLKLYVVGHTDNQGTLGHEHGFFAPARRCGARRAHHQIRGSGRPAAGLRQRTLLLPWRRTTARTAAPKTAASNW